MFFHDFSFLNLNKKDKSYGLPGSPNLPGVPYFFSFLMLESYCQLVCWLGGQFQAGWLAMGWIHMVGTFNPTCSMKSPFFKLWDSFESFWQLFLASLFLFSQETFIQTNIVLKIFILLDGWDYLIRISCMLSYICSFSFSIITFIDYHLLCH